MSNWKDIVQAIQDYQGFGVGNSYDGNIAGAIRAFEDAAPTDPTSYDQNWRGFIDAAIAASCSTNGSSNREYYDDSIAGAIRMFQDLAPGEETSFDYNIHGLLLAIQNATCGGEPPSEDAPAYIFGIAENSMYLHLIGV